MEKDHGVMVLFLENNCQMCYLEEETPDDKRTRDNLDEDPFELTQTTQVLDLLIRTENKQDTYQI